MIGVKARFSRVDDWLCRLRWRFDAREAARVCAVTAVDPLHLALFGSEDEQHGSVLKERLAAWSSLDIPRFPAPGAEMASLRPFAIWVYPMAIAQFIRSLPGKIFGFAGPPGSGKSTLVALLIPCLQALDCQIRVAGVSLDDFYLSREERARRGLRWRAQPGTHDIRSAVDLMQGVQEERGSLRIPRFDPRQDSPGTASQIQGALSLLLFEGWIVGMRDGGYEKLSEMVDFLIYLDYPLPLAKRRRLQRERELRSSSGQRGGFSAPEMLRFWHEVLEPGIEKWVLPIKEHADLVISLGATGGVVHAKLIDRGCHCFS